MLTTVYLTVLCLFTTTPYGSCYYLLFDMRKLEFKTPTNIFKSPELVCLVDAYNHFMRSSGKIAI